MDRFITRTTRKADPEAPSPSGKEKVVSKRSMPSHVDEPSAKQLCVVDARGGNTPEKREKQRSFQSHWLKDRPWLKDGSKGMYCEYCMQNEEKIKHFINPKNRSMLDGNLKYKLETIESHARSKAHIYSATIHDNRLKPAKAPAVKAMVQLTNETKEKLNLLFRNVHALIKSNKSFRDFKWLCQLDDAKGLYPGNTYRTDKAARQIAKTIARVERLKLAEELLHANFISLICDGSTDASFSEQEVLYVRYATGGSVQTKFVGLGSPNVADANGLKDTIVKILQHADTSMDDLKHKLVGFGCDGAAVNMGSQNGLGVLLKDTFQPSMVTIHCMAHR